MKNIIFFGKIIFIFLILFSVHPARAYAIKFLPGMEGFISFTGPAPVPGSVMLFLGTARVLPSGPEDIIVGMGVYPPKPFALVPMRILRPSSDGALLDVTGNIITGGYPKSTHPRYIIPVGGKGAGSKNILIGCHGYDTSPFPGELNIYLENSGNGKLVNRSSALPQINDFTHSVAAGDIDGDGRVDLYIGNIWGQQAVGPYFLMGNATGGFDRNTARLPLELTSLQRIFTSSALVDIDNDGHLDLVLGSADGSRSCVLLNDGAGNFSFSRAIQLPPALFADANTITLFVLPMDLNKDGYQDLLLSQTKNNPFYAGRGIQVLINQKGTGFIDETSSRMPAGTVSDTTHWIPFLTAADLDQDGSLDLIASQCWPKETTPFVWLNDGKGHFTSYNFSQIKPPEAIMPHDYYAVAVTDLNQDEVQDLVFLYDTDQTGGFSTSGWLSYKSLLNTSKKRINTIPLPHLLLLLD